LELKDLTDLKKLQAWPITSPSAVPSGNLTCNMAIENGPFIDDLAIKVVIFHSYAG
jgi:hypothetical protein